VKLMPIVYVTDMERAVDFYSRLGLRVRTRSRMWSELECGGGAVLGLHQDDEPAAPSPLRVELTLASPEPSRGSPAGSPRRASPWPRRSSTRPSVTP
jgi:catechol 2,3-dioxygenase-like lactoylglutathione lyase family enzyme